MGISSAMNAGVMGLNVNSSKLSTISDNIANSETKGYKRTNVEFSSLVLTERPTSYDAGGVRAATVREIEDQGALLSTRNTMDLAISGRGFLPVTDISAIERGEADLPQMLTRTGSFRPDENGVLRTNSGYALMGWKANDGSFTDGVARESAVDLDPVNVSDVALAAEPTKTISLGANLDARQTGGNVTPAPPAFPVSVEYFDVLGGAEKLDIKFTPDNAADNQWTMGVYTPDAPDVPVGFFTLNFSQKTDPNVPTQAGYLEAVAVGAQATNADGDPLYVDPVDPDLTTTVATNPAKLDAGGAPVSDVDGNPIYVAPDGSDTLAENNAPFAADGTWNPADGEITVLLPDGLERTIKIGKLGEQGELSQFKAESAPSNISKDGSPVSEIVGLEISEAGVLDAIFSSGFRKSIYKIPIGNVQNPNGLNALDGQVYTLSRESGSIYYYDAGAGPTGRLVSSALEESTTDIAEELTQLIKTQRAYSSNAKIIQTVDEMLQETTNLKR